MESKEGSTSSQEQHHTGATYRLHSEYKTKGFSHHSNHIWSTRTTESSCHCLQDISYRNCRKTNYNGMNYFLFIYNKNGIICNRPFPNYHTSSSTERSFVPMLPTFNSMDSATAVNEPMEPVCAFAPQTTTYLHVNLCAPLQRWHHWKNWPYQG